MLTKPQLALLRSRLEERATQPWLERPTPECAHDIFMRVADGVEALEAADRDWISAVHSERFEHGLETVGRVISYPEKTQTSSSETFRLVDALGLDRSGNVDRYGLVCGVTFKGILSEELLRLAWQCAADIAEDILSRNSAGAVR